MEINGDNHNNEVLGNIDEVLEEIFSICYFCTFLLSSAPSRERKEARTSGLLFLFNNVILVFYLFFMFSNLSLAKTSEPVEFFSSNNTAKIDIQTAYNRLIGKEQCRLKSNVIKVMKDNHLEQDEFSDILGLYQAINKGVTADNVEEFSTSPLQTLTDEKIFFLAKSLAKNFHQESTVVFVPDDNSAIANIILEFVSWQPSINEALNILDKRLPTVYKKSFSLHLKSKNSDFNAAKVTAIEWLGSKLEIAKVKQAFPLENVRYRRGKAFLIFKDGRKELL